MNKKIVALAFVFLVGGIGVGYGLGYAIYQPQIVAITDRYENLNTTYGELIDRYSGLYNKRINCTVVYQSNLVVPNVTLLEDGAIFTFPLNLNYNISSVVMKYNVTETWVVRYWIGSYDTWTRYLEGKGLVSVGGVLEQEASEVSLDVSLNAIGAFVGEGITNYLIIFSTNWKEEVRLDVQIDIILTQYNTHLMALFSDN